MPKVSIVGIGPGGLEDLTHRGSQAIREAECLIGAKRMLSAVALPGQELVEAIAPEKIAQAIRERKEFTRFAVVMAGDIGFYSGTKKLLPLISNCDRELIPGLSSLVTLCARLGTSYEDVHCVSLHGRDGDILGALRNHSRVFALVGGENGMGELCRKLTDHGFGNLRISVGERLGYPEECITIGTPEELAEKCFDSLSAALLEWENDTVVTHGLPDEVFLRGTHGDGSAVPMTKRDVRACALSRLQLTKNAVCWDIGAGTGSVSMEMAMQASQGWVYAVEKKEGAIALLRENRRAMGISNLTVVEGSAPEACASLPAPTHVFIGGSSGNLDAIIAQAREKNPRVRIVATAIALETIGELNRIAGEYPGSDCTCITAASARAVGRYHLMTGQNPVYLFTFQGDEHA